MKKLLSTASVVLCLGLTACGPGGEAGSASSPAPASRASSSAAASRAPSSLAAIQDACASMTVLSLAMEKVTPTGSADNLAYLQKMLEVATEQRDTGPWELRESFDSVAGAVDAMRRVFSGHAPTSEIDKAQERMDAARPTYNKFCDRT